MLICQVPRSFTTRSLSQISQPTPSPKLKPKHQPLFCPDCSTDLDSKNEEGHVNSPSSLKISKRKYEHLITPMAVNSRPLLSQFSLTPASTRKKSPYPRCLLQKCGKTFLVPSKIPENPQNMPLKTRKSRRKSVPANRRCSTASTSPGISHTKMQHSPKARNVPLVTSSLLYQYWEKKKALDEKYNQLLAILAVEEATEISIRVGPKTAKAAAEIAESVKNEYAVTKLLLMHQKIVEHEEILNEFREKAGPTVD